CELVPASASAPMAASPPSTPASGPVTSASKVRASEAGTGNGRAFAATLGLADAAGVAVATGVVVAPGVATGAVAWTASGCGAGVWRSLGAVAHPANTRLKSASGAKARRHVNPRVNSHPHGDLIWVPSWHRFRFVTVLG